MFIERITTNIGGGNVRQETLHGREYMVVPMTMLTEGVHSGSYGPLYYPAAELAKSPATWNLKPIVVYHPAQGTATDPVELAKRQVGIIMNTRWERGRLMADAWLEPSLLNSIAPEVAATIKAGRTVEVSTGLYTDNYPSPGTWNGEPYELVAQNYRPDHLAILPTGKGACSVADGCGLLQLNKEHHMNHETPLGPPPPSVGTAPIFVTTPAPTANAVPPVPMIVDNSEEPLGLPNWNWGEPTDKPCCGDQTNAGHPVGNQAANSHQHATDARDGDDTPLGLPQWQF